MSTTRLTYFDFDDSAPKSEDRGWLQITVMTITDRGQSHQRSKEKILRVSPVEQKELLRLLLERAELAKGAQVR